MEVMHRKDEEKKTSEAVDVAGRMLALHVRHPELVVTIQKSSL